MTNRERKKLNKIITKYYHLYGFMYQRLYINSIEVMDKDSSILDIHLWDEKKKEHGTYLFTVRNYNGFWDSRIYLNNYFKNPHHQVIQYWDGVKASCSPLYLNEVYTLPKFTGITKSDIINCTYHFIRKILNNYWIWNIHFGTDKEEK
jgi:hypothetical protein